MYGNLNSNVNKAKHQVSLDLTRHAPTTSNWCHTCRVLSAVVAVAAVVTCFSQTMCSMCCDLRGCVVVCGGGGECYHICSWPELGWVILDISRTKRDQAGDNYHLHPLH